jgi:hypothetical protein
MDTTALLHVLAQTFHLLLIAHPAFKKKKDYSRLLNVITLKQLE